MQPPYRPSRELEERVYGYWDPSAPLAGSIRAYELNLLAEIENSELKENTKWVFYELIKQGIKDRKMTPAKLASLIYRGHSCA